MKAIIETGGKQYLVSEGSVIYVEKLGLEAGETVKFDKVLMLDGTFGNPYVENATVTGKVEKQGKAKKIVIYTYKQKKQSTRRKAGHRQPYTKVEITKIG